MTRNSQTKPKPRLPRWPFVLLVLMTLFSFGGPFAFGYVLAGGSSNRWPPDRAVEWATLLGISAAVLVLMAACLSLALVNRKTMLQIPDAAKTEVSRSEP